MSAKQEQIELFVAEATHSLGSVRRSLDVVALGSAELSSAVVGVARSMGETATRFDLADLADICAMVVAEVPQVALEELPQRTLWEPLFEALQAALDAVAVGETPSTRAVVAAIAHLKGESTDSVHGEELENSYAELGLAEFAFTERGGASEDSLFQENFEESEASDFANFADLFAVSTEGDDVEELTAVQLEESVTEVATEAAGFSGFGHGFGELDRSAEGIEELTEATAQEQANPETRAVEAGDFAGFTDLFEGNTEGEDIEELMATQREEPGAEATTEVAAFSDFGDVFGEAEITAEEQGNGDFADLLEGNTGGDTVEELATMQREEPGAEVATEVAAFSDFGDVFGEAEVAAEEQGNGDFADLLEGNTGGDTVEELATMQREEPGAEVATEVAAFSDFGDVFGEAEITAEEQGNGDFADLLEGNTGGDTVEELATMQREEPGAEVATEVAAFSDFGDVFGEAEVAAEEQGNGDFADLLEGNTGGDAMEELAAVQREEPGAEATTEVAAFSDFGDVFGEAEVAAEEQGNGDFADLLEGNTGGDTVEELAAVQREEPGAEATTEVAAFSDFGDVFGEAEITAEEQGNGDFADLLEGSTGGDAMEELAAVQREEPGAEATTEVAAFSDFGDVFGEAEVAAEEQGNGDFADLLEGSTGGDAMEELATMQREEPGAEATTEVAAFSDFGDVFGEAEVAAEEQGNGDFADLLEGNTGGDAMEELATMQREEPGAEATTEVAVFSDFGDVFGEAEVAAEEQGNGDFADLLEGNTGGDAMEELAAVQREEPGAEATTEVAAFSDFGDVFGEAEVAAEEQGNGDFADLLEGNTGGDTVEELAAVQREEPGAEATTEVAAFSDFGDVFGEAEITAEEQGNGDFADLLEGSTGGDAMEELAAVQREEPGAEATTEVAAFSDFGDVFGEAEVAAEEQGNGDFADLLEGSTGGDAMEELAAVQREEPGAEATTEVAAFSDFGSELAEAEESVEIEGLAEIDLQESMLEEIQEVAGVGEFLGIGDRFGGFRENNEFEELTGSESTAMTFEALEKSAEEVTDFPDFEDVFGENNAESGELAVENLAVETMKSVGFGNVPEAPGESEFDEAELEMDFAKAFSEIEESVQAESAVLVGEMDVEPTHGVVGESDEDFTELAGLFDEDPTDEIQEIGDALSGLNLDSEMENYASEMHSIADSDGAKPPEKDLGLGELFDGLSDADIVAIADSLEEQEREEFSGIDDLENFLGVTEESSQTLDVLSGYFDSGFGDTDTAAATMGTDSELNKLEDLLADSLPGETSGLESLDSLLVSAEPATAPAGDDFADLSSLLDSTIGRSSVPSRPIAGADGKKASQRVTAMKVKVDVTYLDSLNNLVGELVVNRNLLASDSERMHGFITNLLNQVQLLSEVSQKMRDTFDRSVLETSVIANRPRGFSGFQQMLAVDRDRPVSGEVSSDSHDIRSRFTGDTFDTYNEYHILSQEIIELIVKIKESTSDIEFVVSETEQVTRQLGTITTQVQNNLKQLRMLPFSQLTDRLPRGVRDRALQANKKAEITFEGTDTLIDKAILEQLQDPMVHLVNNAIDHGIEDPETRRQRGKPEVGQLTVRAYHQGNQTVITVSDDGGGIDPEKVKQSAVRKGLLTPAEAAKLSDTEAFNLIFRPGFSTATVADMYKGRGVGMDVVKSSIEEIRGSILTESEVGKGTTFTIRLPLTLSITKAMTCVSNRNKIAFPVDSVEDMLEIPRNQIQLNSKGEPTLPWRDTMLPFLPLSSLLTYNRQISRGSVYGKQDDEILSILVLRNDNNFLALQTDQIIGESEIVIKQLEGPVPQPPGIAGATILGDGRVMAIANVLELFDIASGRLRFKFDVAEPPQEVDEQHDPVVLIVDDSITVRELLSVTFSKVGYRVEQARDGQDAWDKLRSGLPCDLIFCDIEMPKMDGLELLSRVKKDENLKKIPMAMLTSRGAERHRQTARELGANGYFTKPYLEEEVITASKRLLKGERLVDGHS